MTISNKELPTSNKQALFSFLADPKFRVWRHMLFVFLLGTVAFNRVISIYHKDAIVLGNYIYWIALASSVAYIGVTYFNLYVLVPKLLLNKKYTWHIIALGVLAALFLLSQLVQEYAVRTAFDLPHRVASYTSPVILLFGLCFSATHVFFFAGTSASVLFKRFTTESQRESQLKKESVQLEVNSLKEQITPDLFSKILKQTSVLAESDQEKTSDMLIKLSQLLRYQLYDCSRDKVLLSSVVKFITNYLTLEQLHNSKINYKISTAGNISRTFTPPLLFIPFVRHAVSSINNYSDKVVIQLHFEVNNGIVIFTCKLSDSGISLESDFVAIRQRLNLLYNNNYALLVKENIIHLELTPLRL